MGQCKCHTGPHWIAGPCLAAVAFANLSRLSAVFFIGLAEWYTVDCQIKVTIGLAIYIYIPDQTPTIPNLFWYGIAINIPQ